MAIKRGAALELDITRVAFGGRGIAKPEGFTIFVDGTVPGDRVLARIIRKKKNYAEARALEILSPSELRIPAPCRYSDHCGGCKWQFLPYEVQLGLKREHVAESLKHIGLLEAAPVRPVIPSEKVFGYRNKMEFSCSDRRWLMPHELGREDIPADFGIGLHVPGAFFKVLDIEECLIQPARGNDLLAETRAHIRNSDLPVYGLKSHEGFWRFLMVRHSEAEDQWMVNLITAWEDREAVLPLAERIREKYPEVVSVVNNVTARKAGIAVGEYEVHLAGAPVIQDRIGKYRFEISANSFFQTNTRGAETLYGVVRDFAGLAGTETVLDLYCGTGTIGIFLSEAAREVIGVEMAESSVADARRNAEFNGVANCRFLAGDIKEVLPAIEARPDVVILDPPRAGLHKDVVPQVLDLAPRRIVYVSCNPTTLARDVSLMAEAYEMAEVQPVDLFPHTYHIESVARLERRQSSQRRFWRTIQKGSNK
ncbi:MAG: 23S rRNA (uracil(1939)-C(5))-methyltransferase RlmD [Desulfococcaceae bacterium]